VRINLGIQLVRLERVKEQAFAQDILAFATEKYKSATRGWRVMVQHISDPGRWIDLYDAAKYTGQDPATWLASDAWSMAWDEPVGTGWVHTTNTRRRRMLARKMEMEDFDPAITAEAVNCDLLIFVNDSYANYLARRFRLESYAFYLLTHECLHFVADWCGKTLVVDNVPPWQDRHVLATLSGYVESLGGLNTFKQRYVD
jgi:hypothetical protein